MKIRYSLKTNVLRWLSLMAVVPVALTPSTKFAKAWENPVADIAPPSYDSVAINPQGILADSLPDKNADSQHYLVGMHLSFATDIQNPEIHMVLLKQDDRSQTYTLRIESPKPVSFEGDAMIMLDQ